MDMVLHLGFEHPSLLWIVAASVLAFVAGLGVRFRRGNHRDAPEADVASVDDQE